ncbi:MAG: twin-arginine translocase TatA/TatE family subunit [Gemmatimonadetes bacterium]|nr:twin-arginine translocase TatA/TatE family subunit [Gemmatimonadota bacterium]
MFGGIGMQEILIILVIFLLVFGAKRLPELGQAMGKGIREFKRSVSDIEEELKAESPAPKHLPREEPRPALEAGGPAGVKGVEVVDGTAARTGENKVR